jgi:hypothetical protein
VLALLVNIRGALSAQRWSVSGEFSRSLHSGEGVEADCLYPNHRAGLGGQIGARLDRVLTLALTGRAFIISHSPDCIDGLRPPSGTFIEIDRTDLHTTAFGTSDLRLRVRGGPQLGGFSVGLGAGAAWHPGRDWPYALAELGTSIAVAKRTRIVLATEYQYLRLSWHEYRRTYQNYQIIASEPLGTVRRWSHDFLVSLSVAALF